jgi:hypothetical protein
MTFDEQLTLAFETLSERLRGDIDAQLRRTAADLAAAHQDVVDERLAGVLEAGRQEALEARAPQAFDASFGERVHDGVRSIERARSLTEILDMLALAARQEAGHADIWLIRGGRPHQWRAPESDGAGAPAPPIDASPLVVDAARTQDAARDGGALAVPIAIAGSVVAVLHVELGTEHVELKTQHVELLTRYAARSLEALTAFKVARALTEQPDGDRGGAASPADEAGAEEDTSARRYARLLVSEIKLYHEAAVIDGRRDRDLATRLGGEIARARVMYEQRVPSHVRERADYFHDELVKTLANGDATLLELRT